MSDPAQGVFAPGFQVKPYWWEAAEPEPETAGALPERVDVAIVGGGYAGLSASLTLSGLGREALVMDAETIGWGASSRNGGQVSGSLKPSLAALKERYGVERGRAVADAASAAFPFIESLIAREAIACDYVRAGKFTPAWSGSHYRALEQKRDLVAELTGMPTRMVTPDRQKEELASDHYRGGMVTEASGLLHPGRYARGLRDAARRSGVRLASKTRVAKVSRDAEGFHVETSRGTLKADAVLVATNGYSLSPEGASAMPWLARRLIPLASYIIATEELGEERVRRLFPTMRGISDTRHLLNYYRPSPDGKRILWGGRASFVPTSPEKAAPRLHRFMTDVFPELRDVRITHAWTGNVAFTFDFLPHIGVEDGVHFAAGCQGSGVAMASWLGHQVALKIAGRNNEPFALDGLPFPTKPFYSGRPWFMPMVGEWYRLRDLWDRRRA